VKSSKLKTKDNGKKIKGKRGEVKIKNRPEAQGTRFKGGKKKLKAQS